MSEQVTLTIASDAVVVIENPTIVAVAAPGPQGPAGGPFTRGASMLYPIDGMDIVVWRCTFPAQVLAVRGNRRGGSGATVNARRIPGGGGPSADHLLTDLSLPEAEVWFTGAVVQNSLYAIGDTMQIRVRTVTDNPEQVAVQVDMARL